MKATGLIAWFASNPIAANLLMLLILAGGFFQFESMDKEVFPRLSPHQIIINAYYPGTSPLEMEESVCVRIEEAIYDTAGIKRLNTEVSEGECAIKVAVLADSDTTQVMNALRGKVQAIQRLPKGIENIEVRLGARDDDDGVIWVALHGQIEPLALKRFAEKIQQDLSRIEGVTKAFNYNETAYEMTIDVSTAKLRQYQLTLAQIAEAVRQSSLDLSGGLIKTPNGELLLRVKGKTEQVALLKKLVLRHNAAGGRLLLGDVATIKNGLEERIADWHHNGENAQGWEIHADHNTVEVARRVKDYVAQTAMPQGLKLATWWDDSVAYEERVQTLVEDGLSGFLLVCLVLSLFLRLRVAIWAGFGILTSIFGALWLMPFLDISLNMLSLFGFLLAMGILVDDAIIIGESVHSHQQARPESKVLQGTIAGVQEVALPVTLSVCVALVAFLPGLFLPGWSGQMMKPICLVMILTMMFSLIEALLILPAHLSVAAHVKASRLEAIRNKFNQALEAFVRKFYTPFLHQALNWRYLTLSFFLIFILLSSALVVGKHVRQSLNPDVSKDNFWVLVTLPPSAPYSEIRALAAKVEQGLFKLRDAIDKQTPTEPSVIGGFETMIWEHDAGFWLEFSPQGRKRLVVENFVRDWRKEIGDLGRGKIDFIYKEGDVPYDIEFFLGSSDPEILSAAAQQMKAALAHYNGVYDVVDSFEPGKPEVRLRLKPHAEILGLRLAGLAEQVHDGYFGAEVHRLQHGSHEMKVMLRYPLKQRQSLDSLAEIPILLPNGSYAPLQSLVEITLMPGFAKLYRQDRQRILKVLARVDPKQADVNAIYAEMENTVNKQLQHKYLGLNISIGQERQEQQAMTDSLIRNTVISLVVIYALIAVPFRSYTKPLIFLLAAPVAWSGAVVAHGLVGLPLSMESLVGMIAASGVVVNDSLVLLDYIKEHADDNIPLEKLISNACAARFRPIFLAFLTNFAGFLPTLMETNTQAQFLIPMTLSLSAGLLVGMAASLVLTPVCYAVLGK